MLYPENPQHLRNVANDPAHRFFRAFGDAVPKQDWNHPGTKQGIYMIGPNSEYLEGKFAAAGAPRDIEARMRRALARWEDIRQQKGYANQPVPKANTAAMPPEVEGKPLVLRVSLRDLPKGPGDDAGRRYGPQDATNQPWPDFTKWAWNQNWIAFDQPGIFVPRGSSFASIDSRAVRRLAREALVDNVRGQAPHWNDRDIQVADLQMRLLDRSTAEYRGRLVMSAGGRSYAPTLYGQGRLDGKGGLTSLEIVAIGQRSGASRFNMRDRDKGPAPMGIVLTMQGG